MGCGLIEIYSAPLWNDMNLIVEFHLYSSDSPYQEWV